MKRMWTIATATAYAEANSTSNRGLKFCSAIDFLRSNKIPVSEYLTPTHKPKTNRKK